MVPRLLTAAVALAVLLSGCTAAASPTPTSSPSATASPTATITATATSTATPISPTATLTPRPAPTATSVTNIAAAPAPGGGPSLNFSVDPARVAQGGIAIVDVPIEDSATEVRGQIDGVALVFTQEPGHAWAVVGFRSDAPLGPRRVTVNAGGLQSAVQIAVVAGRFQVESIWVPEEQGELLSPAMLNREWAQLLDLTRRVTGDKRWQGAFILPSAAEISSPYGIRRSYNGGPPGSPHEGLDFAAATGDKVVAANSGVIAFAGPWEVRGNAVVIDHGLGVYSGYYHLSEIAVATGQTVSKGDFIGRVGATGLATGPHLHWEIVVRGNHTEPLQWTQHSFP